MKQHCQKMVTYVSSVKIAVATAGWLHLTIHAVHPAQARLSVWNG